MPSDAVALVSVKKPPSQNGEGGFVALQEGSDLIADRVRGDTFLIDDEECLPFEGVPGQGRGFVFVGGHGSNEFEDGILYGSERVFVIRHRVAFR